MPIKGLPEALHTAQIVLAGTGACAILGRTLLGHGEVLGTVAAVSSY